MGDRWQARIHVLAKELTWMNDNKFSDRFAWKVQGALATMSSNIVVGARRVLGQSGRTLIPQGRRGRAQPSEIRVNMFIGADKGGL